MCKTIFLLKRIYVLSTLHFLHIKNSLSRVNLFLEQQRVVIFLYYSSVLFIFNATRNVYGEIYGKNCFQQTNTKNKTKNNNSKHLSERQNWQQQLYVVCSVNGLPQKCHKGTTKTPQWPDVRHVATDTDQKIQNKRKTLANTSVPVCMWQTTPYKVRRHCISNTRMKM